MLPTRHRMRTSAQFSATVRSGARSGRRNVVVSVRLNTGEDTRVGFVVSKAVGNAVTRNKVKRRLRELTAQTVREHPRNLSVVVRALPAAAGASWQELGQDYAGAFDGAVRRQR